MKAQEVSDALEAAQRRFGPVDIAVNNAGGIITSDGNLSFVRQSVGWGLTGNIRTECTFSSPRKSRTCSADGRTWMGQNHQHLLRERGSAGPCRREYAAAKGALNAFTKALSKAYWLARSAREHGLSSVHRHADCPERALRSYQMPRP